MVKSKLTSEARTTIPQPVRAALGLQAGDEIAYTIESGRVVMTKATLPERADEPFRVFSEWGSEADRGAYDTL